MSIYGVISVCCVIFPYCLASEKFWLPDLEWQTKSNWVDSFVPEAGSHVVFPEEMRHSVGLPKSGILDVSGIDLPRDGALVLTINGKLKVSESKESQKRTGIWSREGPLLWADPDNWNSSGNGATPDLDRIPCSTDVVVLPGTDRTLSLRLPRAEVKVKAVKIAGDTDTLPVWEWQSLQRRGEFSKGPRSVGYSGLQSCEDCSCHEAGGGEILKEVCEIAGGRCKPLACANPMKVEGHCCYYCGARVLLSKTASVSSVRRKVNEALKKFNSKLSWYVRKTWEDNTEVLITEKNAYSGIESAEAVDNLAVLLKEEGIDVLGTETAGAELKGSRLANALGPLFGAPLIILVLLLIAFPYFGYSYAEVFSAWRESWTSNRNGTGTAPMRFVKPFGFARFENASEPNVDLAHPPHSLDDDEDQEAGTSSSGARFANPLYHSKRGPSNVQKASIIQESVTLAELQKAVLDSQADEEVDLNLYIEN